LFGGHYLYLFKSEQLTGRFNEHLRDAIFIFADEAFFAGDRKNEGSLKSIITEPVLTIEAKHGAVVTAPNYAHLMMATNNDWAIPATDDERRFAVFDVSDAVVRDFTYFNALNAQMAAGGLAAMLHALLRHNISNFNIRDVPQTDGLRDQKLLSLKGVPAWIYDCLQNAKILGVEGSGWDNTGISFSGRYAHESFAANAKLYRCERDIPTQSWWSREIRKILDLCDQRVDGNRQMVLGSLDGCRLQFEKHIGHEIDWDPAPEPVPVEASVLIPSVQNTPKRA
jgi:hypothetical protein